MKSDNLTSRVLHLIFLITENWLLMTELKHARILAVETSCDETACAVIENGRELLASTVASQMEIHARYGGVFPEVASRQHVLSITPVIEQTLAAAHLSLGDVDAIAVTRGPGLAGSLVVGVNAAKGLSLGTGLPLIGVNTFTNPQKDYQATTTELIRSSAEEKQDQLSRLEDFQKRHADRAPGAIEELKRAALAGENVFGHIVDAVQVLSLGQVTQALYEVGGQYRRNM